MRIDVEPFGTAPCGAPVERHTLRGPLVVRASTWGARVTELHAPDRDGRPGNIVLGFDRPDPYLHHASRYGATIGRVANRIAHAWFELDGTRHSLAANEGRHHLHGGRRGFDRVVWSAEPEVNEDGASITFRHRSPDGDEGYPGSLEVLLRMTLTPGAELRLEYEATTDRPTLVNLTHHSFFNLAGAGSGDVGDHRLTLEASNYLPVDAERIPTGDIAGVAGTAYDFRTAVPMGARRSRLPLGGYDHNFVLDRSAHPAHPAVRAAAGDVPVTGTVPLRAARVLEPRSGRVLEVETTAPGLQFYDGNMMDGSLEGIGGRYGRFGGFCLEAQHWPDAVHHAGFPSIVLRPGETWRQRTVYRFSTLAQAGSGPA